MTLEEKVFAALTDESPSLRVYPDIAPPQVMLPFVVYTFVAGSEDVHLQGHSGIGATIVQVSVYASTRLRASEVMEEVKSLMFASTDFTVNGIDLPGADRYEPDTKRYRSTVDFSLRYETALDDITLSVEETP